MTAPVAAPATAERKPLTKKELAADHPTWCPGCGDFSVLALYFKLIEKRKLHHEKLTTIAGKTSLDLARAKGHKDIVKLLTAGR